MSKEENISQLIEDYLNGDLAPTEKTQFEKDLATQPALKQAVEDEKLIREAIMENSVLSFQAELHQEFNRQKRIERIKFIGIISILLVASITTLLYLNPFSPEEKEESPVKIKEHQSNNKTNLPSNKKKPHHTGVKQKTPDQEKRHSKNEHLNTSNSTLPHEQGNEDITLNSPTSDSLIIADTASQAIENNTESTINTTNAGNTKVSTPLPSKCKGVLLTAKVTPTPTCEGEEKGKLVVSTITGGTPPYVIQLNDRDWQEETYFTFLSAGEYSIQLKDSKNCTSTLPQTSEIVEEYCFIPKKGFNPDYETWEYLGHWDTPVKITIRNKSGIIVYQEEIEDDFEWDGLDSQGNIVPKGLYLYTIESKNPKRGTVTVIN